MKPGGVSVRAGAGAYVYGGGWLVMCVNLYAVLLFQSWTNLEFWNLGHRPGIFILGGRRLAVQGGCMGVGMGRPSLLSSDFPSPAYIHSPAVRLHAHSISLREDRGRARGSWVLIHKAAERYVHKKLGL